MKYELIDKIDILGRKVKYRYCYTKPTFKIFGYAIFKKGKSYNMI